MEIENLRRSIWASIFILIGILLILFILIKPAVERIPDDFRYEADILSIDNFYDAGKGDFTGDLLSNSKFIFDAVNEKDHFISLEGSFDVKKITGEKIFSIERLYGIDSRTGKHTVGYGDKDRTGYLFAPKNLKKNESYIYWHINYDSPAYMKFQNEEEIYGLKVYRYKAEYNADQTENLLHLPGVPEERGVTLDIDLQLWIEPFTGRLIKYEDYAIAYYYDIKTQERLTPWNEFNNRYHESSVVEQVNIAKNKKLQIILLFWVLPIVLIIVILVLVFVLFKTYKKSRDINFNKKYAKIFLIIGIFIIIILLIILSKNFLNLDDGKIKIGISRWIGNEQYEENIEGFKKALSENGYNEGENIEFLEGNSSNDLDKQIDLIKLFVDEEVDIIYSLTTYGTFIARSVTKDIPIVFSILIYPIETHLIDSLENSGNNLVGTRPYVPVIEQYKLFQKIYPDIKSLAYVHREDEPNSVIQYKEFKDLLDQKEVEIIVIASFSLDDLEIQLEENKDKIDSLYSGCDALISEGGEEIVIEFGRKYKKPVFTCNKNGVIKGALAGNVADLYEMGYMAGEKAVLILNGAKPNLLSTESPEKGDVIINLKTANEIGINIPQDLIDEADEIVK